MRTYLFLFLFFPMARGFTQILTPASFSITPEFDFPAQPLSIDMTSLNYNEDQGKLVVGLKEGNRLIMLPSQLIAGNTPRLWFLPSVQLSMGKTYRFQISYEADAVDVDHITVQSGPEDIMVFADGQEVLRYRHAMMEAPEGANPLYRREGAYIHPLYSPGGNILTRIQPDDHYHHYGIWNPWTHTVFEGRQVDFWNLALGQGTVRHGGIIFTISGPLCGGFRVYHEHVDFTAPGPDKKALNEVWDVKVWMIEINQRPVWIIDYVFLLSCATDSAVELSQYRYGGGIGFRGTSEWTRNNSTVLTSEGKPRKDADASNARWCRVEGATGKEGRSGVVFMSHPANRSHPEPMRVWPEDAAGGRGDQFFEFCPIRHEKWVMKPGETNLLRYRMLVFDDTMDEEMIETLWQNFAHPPMTVFH